MCMLIWPLPLRFSAMTFIKEKLDTYRLLFNFPAVTEETKKLVPRAFSSEKARPSPPASSQFPMERSFFYMSTSELYPLLISTIFTSPMASLRSKHFQWSYCRDLCFHLNNIESYESVGKDVRRSNFLEWTSTRHSIPPGLKDTICLDNNTSI